MPHADPVARRLYMREWKRKNRDRVRAEERERHAQNADELNRRRREIYAANKERAKRWRDGSRSRHGWKAAARASRWRAANLEKARAGERRRAFRKRETRPWEVAARGLVVDGFRRRYRRKNCRTATVIGCSFDELRDHLSRQFEPGMSWENWGEWHIDHIVPLSQAGNEHECIQLCHYTNLRPLWGSANIRRQDRTDDLSCPWPRTIS